MITPIYMGSDYRKRRRLWADLTNLVDFDIISAAEFRQSAAAAGFVEADIEHHLWQLEHGVFS